VEDSYGHQFYRVAVAPIQAMHDLLGRKEIGAALDAVHPLRLTEAFDRGIDDVTRETGASRANVLRLVAAEEVRAAAEASGASQQRAVEVSRRDPARDVRCV